MCSGSEKTINYGRINFTLSQKAISYLRTHRRGERSSLVDRLIVQYHERSGTFDPLKEEQELSMLKAEIAAREQRLLEHKQEEEKLKKEQEQHLQSEDLKEKLIELVTKHPDILKAYTKNTVSSGGKEWILLQLGISSWNWVEEQLKELTIAANNPDIPDNRTAESEEEQ